jgi:hypothetical protein
MWHRRTIKLDRNSSIRAKDGNNVFVANRGDVSFEYPCSWIVRPSEKSICFYDAEPPADQCVLEFSIMHLNFGVDWSNAPLDQILWSAVGGDPDPIEPTSVHKLKRGDLQIVWLERHFIDPVEKRLALSRCAVALRAGVLPLFTFSFWPEQKPKCEPVWKDIFETLRLAEGRRFKMRN